MNAIVDASTVFTALAGLVTAVGALVHSIKTRRIVNNADTKQA
jgi:hypothetical protein